MRDWFGKARKRVKNVAAWVWQHRVSYAGLAAVYGAGCVGAIDKELVAQIVAGIYAAIAVQQH